LVKIAPDTASAHDRLAKAYASMGQERKAIRQYLALAVIYQQMNDHERATAACQSALELDPHNSDVLTALEALQHGRSLSELVERESTDLFYTSPEVTSEKVSDVAGPVEMTRQRALTELASSLLEDSDEGGMELAPLLLQGIDYQTRGEVEAAIESYEQAIESGIRHVAAHFNLGLLYQETLRFDEAVEQFQRAVGNPGYAVGAHFALGECLRALGHLNQALVHFIEVLRQVDLSTVGPENADELHQIYNALARGYATAQDRDSVVAFINSLVDFLSGERWEDRLFEIRQHLNRLSDGRVIGLAEILTLTRPEGILTSMVRSQEYFEEGMLRSATEECLWAIDHAPHYLPLHLHLAKLFVRDRQVEMAIGKYLFVADTYAVRDEMDQARALYEQVLRIAPMDLDVRRKLIALLEEHNMIDAALEERLALADAYYELAQIESSREQYEEAFHLASQLADSKAWTARILHRLGDIDLQRIDWRSAIDVYLQLKAAVPEDLKARQRLVELYFNLQRQAEAVAELDNFIDLLRRQGELQRALEVVEELSGTRRDELELHKRAAQLCVETGDKEGAIAHLDTMGELQLQAGRVEEAVATIKAIIALGPESAEAYRQLLEQITQ
jgi:tetratricopeptide (TPR) repeat protein